MKRIAIWILNFMLGATAVLAQDYSLSNHNVVPFSLNRRSKVRTTPYSQFRNSMAKITTTAHDLTNLIPTHARLCKSFATHC